MLQFRSSIHLPGYSLFKNANHYIHFASKMHFFERVPDYMPCLTIYESTNAKKIKGLKSIAKRINKPLGSIILFKDFIQMFMHLPIFQNALLLRATALNAANPHFYNGIRSHNLRLSHLNVGIITTATHS